MDKKSKIDYVKIILVGIPLTFILWGSTFLVILHLTHNPTISKYVSMALAVIFLPIYLYFSIKYADKLDASNKTATDSDASNVKAIKSRISVPMLRFGAVIGWIVMILSARQKIGNLKEISILFCVSLIVVFPLCAVAWKYRVWFGNTKKGRVLAPLSVPVGLFFWKWIGSVSIAAEHISMFTVILFFTFMVFFFEKDNLKF